MQEISSSLQYAIELLSIMSSITDAEYNPPEFIRPRPIPLKEVVQKNKDMSLNFLEQIARKLRIAGMLEVVRGPGGGYRVTRPYGNISIGNILHADILRHSDSKSNKTPLKFKITKALGDVYTEHMDNFRDTVLTDLKGFGK